MCPEGDRLGLTVAPSSPPRHPVAPDPPRGFRGDYLLDLPHRECSGRASGPIQMVPAAVAIPIDVEDVATLVAWAGREGVALVPRGAGTGMPGGNVGWGVAVELTRMDDLQTRAPDGSRLRVGPGVLAARVESVARGFRRFLPPLPSSADRCTLGGMVANNAAGARSFRHGAMHAWVDGLEVVLADGTVAELEAGRPHPAFLEARDRAAAAMAAVRRPWPAVRKNSSGYALDRFLPHGDPVGLMVGSEGTLGLVTAVELRLAPAPPERALAVLPVPTQGDIPFLVALADSVGASTCEILGRRFLDVSGLRADAELGPLVGAHEALLLVEVEGGTAEVEAGLARLASEAGVLGVPVRFGRTMQEQERLWRARHAASPVVAARAAEGRVSMQFIEDSVVSPERLPSYLAGLEALLAEEETEAVVFGHAGDGNVHVNPLIDVTRPDWRERVARILERTVDLVASLEGTLAGEHGDGRLRAPFHDRVYGADVRGAFGAVKEALDPAGILNPGVVVARPGQDPLSGLSPAPRR